MLCPYCKRGELAMSVAPPATVPAGSEQLWCRVCGHVVVREVVAVEAAVVPRGTGGESKKLAKAVKKAVKARKRGSKK